MVIKRLENEFIKLYSMGKEVDYLGNAVNYDDSTATLLFLYLQGSVRLFVVNGLNKDKRIDPVCDGCNLIVEYRGIEARRMKSFLKNQEIDKNVIYSFPDSFFIKSKIYVSMKSGWKNNMMHLYNYYLKGGK